MNLNSKLRSDSVFAQLTNEQLEVLEDWLFEEKLGYKDVLAKAKTEWNLNTSATSLGRFYRRLALQRSEERRLETVALCLEGLAAKNDGTLQAGLLALANQCAIELLVEQPKSIKEFATLLRALTSAGVFEMKQAELRHAEEQRRQWELEEQERKAKEEKLKRVEQLRWEEEMTYRKARNAKRKATIAAKKAAMQNEKFKIENEKEGETEMANDQASKVKGEEQPKGWTPNAPLELGPVPIEAEKPNAGGASVLASRSETEPPKGGTPSGALERIDGLVEGVDFTINWPGNAEKPLKTH